MGPRSADITDKSVGTRIRMERLAVGMTQQALAEALGVSFQQVQKYEKGVNRVSACRIWQICEALRVPFERLVGAADVGPVPDAILPDIQRFLATREGMSLMTAFCDIESDQTRKELIILVQNIAETSRATPESKGAPPSRRRSK